MQVKLRLEKTGHREMSKQFHNETQTICCPQVIPKVPTPSVPLPTRRRRRPPPLRAPTALTRQKDRHLCLKVRNPTPASYRLKRLLS